MRVRVGGPASVKASLLLILRKQAFFGFENWRG